MNKQHYSEPCYTLRLRLSCIQHISVFARVTTEKGTENGEWKAM